MWLLGLDCVPACNSAADLSALTRSPASLKEASWSHNLQIGNGGQTTALLYAAPRQSAGNLDRVRGQVKLTVVPPDVVPNISKFANSQNKIDAADFFSNHPFHLRVEEFSRRQFAPPAQGTNRQTLWSYERAKGQYLVERARAVGADRTKFDRECPRAQLLLKTDLAKVEYSFRMKLDTVSKGAQKNFGAFATDSARRGASKRPRSTRCGSDGLSRGSSCSERW